MPVIKPHNGTCKCVLNKLPQSGKEEKICSSRKTKLCPYTCSEIKWGDGNGIVKCAMVDIWYEINVTKRNLRPEIDPLNHNHYQLSYQWHDSTGPIPIHQLHYTLYMVVMIICIMNKRFPPKNKVEIHATSSTQQINALSVCVTGTAKDSRMRSLTGNWPGHERLRSTTTAVWRAYFSFWKPVFLRWCDEPPTYYYPPTYLPVQHTMYFNLIWQRVALCQRQHSKGYGPGVRYFLLSEWDHDNWRVHVLQWPLRFKITLLKKLVCRLVGDQVTKERNFTMMVAYTVVPQYYIPIFQDHPWL